MTPLTGPENDYRELWSRPTGTLPTISVIMPAYERPHVLANSLAALVAQTHREFDVVVVDDGSSADLAAVVEKHGDGRFRLIRQERDGFGATRARNRGVGESSGELVVLIDQDTILPADYLAVHADLHSRASNLVVFSDRRHVVAERLNTDRLQAGQEEFEEIPSERAAPDWRGSFARRSAQLTLGDEPFRTGLTNNISVRRDLLDRAGGLDETLAWTQGDGGSFTHWGGDDTEWAWRLWNEGAFFVRDGDRVVAHQVEEGEERGWRDDSRRLARPIVADRVPHRFYRPVPHPYASVPKLSWVVAVATPDDVQVAWGRLLKSSFADAEVLFHGPAEAFPGGGSTVGRITTVVRNDDDLTDVLDATRGEVVGFLDARAHLAPGLAAKAVTRIDEDPRTAGLRVPYRDASGSVFRRIDDLEAIDAGLGRAGAPLLAFITRRELMKDRRLLQGLAGTWPTISGRCRMAFLPGDQTTVDDETALRPSLPGLDEVRSAGFGEAARVLVRRARGIGSPQPSRDPIDDDVAEPGVRVDYVGFTEHDNLGDDAIVVAVRRAMPWARIGRDMTDAHLLMLGGGTLVNGNRYYLNRILRNDSPSIERAVFGVGVRDPQFHGVTEPMEEWWRFFDSSLVVGVRGPDSVTALRALGYKGEVEVIGDPAVLLTPPAGVDRDPSHVVVCPVWTSGNIMGGDDHRVFDVLAHAIRRFVSDGRHVTILSAFPADDRHIIALMRAAGSPDLDYVAGYEDLDTTMRLLASCGLVIAERLHAAILAAACSTPFVGLEYWPKHRDFARSIDLEQLVLPTGDLTVEGLMATVGEVERDRQSIVDVMSVGIERFRTRQLEVANELRQIMGAD